MSSSSAFLLAKLTLPGHGEKCPTLLIKLVLSDSNRCKRNHSHIVKTIWAKREITVNQDLKLIEIKWILTKQEIQQEFWGNFDAIFWWVKMVDTWFYQWKFPFLYIIGLSLSWIFVVENNYLFIFSFDDEICSVIIWIISVNNWGFTLGQILADPSQGKWGMWFCKFYQHHIKVWYLSTFITSHRIIYQYHIKVKSKIKKKNETQR